MTERDMNGSEATEGKEEGFSAVSAGSVGWIGAGLTGPTGSTDVAAAVGTAGMLGITEAAGLPDTVGSSTAVDFIGTAKPGDLPRLGQSAADSAIGPVVAATIDSAVDQAADSTTASAPSSNCSDLTNVSTTSPTAVSSRGSSTEPVNDPTLGPIDTVASADPAASPSSASPAEPVTAATSSLSPQSRQRLHLVMWWVSFVSHLLLVALAGLILVLDAAGVPVYSDQSDQAMMMAAYTWLLVLAAFSLWRGLLPRMRWRSSNWWFVRQGFYPLITFAVSGIFQIGLPQFFVGPLFGLLLLTQSKALWDEIFHE